MANSNKPAATPAADVKAPVVPIATDKPATDTKPAAEVLTSETLTKLHADKKAAFVALSTLPADADEKAQDAALALVQKIQGDIKAEEAAIRKTKLDAELQVKRNERVKLVEAFEAAILAHASAPTDATADALKTAREAVTNQVLVGIAAPAKKSADGVAAAPATGTKSDKIAEMMAAGNTYDEMIAAGMGDGTIRTVAGNLKYRKNANGTYTKKD